jgi:sulfoquinovosidase
MKHRFWILLFAFTLALVMTAGCGGDDDDDDNNDDGAPNPAGWNWTPGTNGAVEIRHGDRLLYTLLGVEQTSFDAHVPMLFGLFRFQTSNETSRVLAPAWDNGNILLTAKGERVGRVNLAEDENGNLAFSIIANGNWRALTLRFAMQDDDRFWGFGEQYNFIEMRGKRVPIWVQEQGLNRLPYPFLPPFGGKLDSYFPMPYFMDPVAGKGLLLNNVAFSRFDLGSVNPTQWSIEVWNGDAAEGVLFAGPQPKDIITQLTATVGRPKTAPPHWAFDGVWIAAQGGTQTVAQRVQTALDAGIPISAVWAQDWLGLRDFGLSNFGVKYRWIHDEELYPDLAEFIAELADEGVRFLGYFNPFVAGDYEHFNEMRAAGYLIKRPDGTPYVTPISTFTASQVDLTNPDAVAYFKGYARKATELGMRGWMCDFGEWLPFDAVLHQGKASKFHNQYPTAWHRINREVLEEAYPDGDFAIFTRSGFARDHEVAQVVWAGDQEATWHPNDGFPTVVKAGLTLGLAGIPFFTHDVGGFSGGPREKELLWRWTELGAFTPVMRTHDGLQKLTNHHFDSAPDTLAMFTKFSLIHAALYPYFSGLIEEAMATGLPMVRHTVLVDPEWKPAIEAHGQWMLGDDLLIAPVVEKGAHSVEVYLPKGVWEHVFTGQIVDGRQKLTVEAPLSQPAAFARVGRLDDVIAEIRAIVD